MKGVPLPQRRVEALLAEADVRPGGERDWDLQVHDQRLYARLLARGSLGLGESYMDGWWDARGLDELLVRLLRADAASVHNPVHNVARDRPRLWLLATVRPGRVPDYIRVAPKLGRRYRLAPSGLDQPAASISRPTF